MPRTARLCLIATLIAPHAAGSPRGVFCSCPPTVPGGMGSVLPQVAALDFVEGFLVRVGWSHIELAPGQYDWTLIDAQIAAADAAGKSISLAVVAGPQSPTWLYGEGAAAFSYQLQNTPRQMPIPWDPVFLSRWTGLIAALGERYRDNRTIALVYATNSSANGFEMQLPFSPNDQANWQAVGYTDTRYATAWNTVVDAFAAAFPDHPVSHEVHPVLGSDAVAQNVATHAFDTHGGRVGVLAAWWMVHNANDVYPGMFDILLQAADRSHGQVQVANSFTNTPERFGPDGLSAEIGLALDSGIRYMEIWNSDLLNADLESLLRDTNTALTGPCPADLAEPFGTLNFFDLAAYITVFNAADPAADLAPPSGVWNFFDLAEYIAQYNARCP